MISWDNKLLSSLLLHLLHVHLLKQGLTAGLLHDSLPLQEHHLCFQERRRICSRTAARNSVVLLLNHLHLRIEYSIVIPSCDEGSLLSQELVFAHQGGEANVHLGCKFLVSFAPCHFIVTMKKMRIRNNCV